MVQEDKLIQEKRWVLEQQFFDAEEYSESPIPANTVERYRSCRKPFLPAELPFWLLGDVRGKRILEVGCGDGGNSVLLALKGAIVEGIDISPRAIQIARKRAEAHGVADRVEFHALPLEAYLERAQGEFDIIIGFAVLHHLLPVLDSVMETLLKLSKPETRFVFTEPVSLSRWARQLRLALPITTYGTPDERPLEPRDLAIVRNYLPAMKMQTSGLLLRVWGRLFPGRYEDYSRLRTAVFDTLARVDSALLSLPGVGRLASSAVICSSSSADAPTASR
jgi:2-polyprenyl-3-methyl-5-hydroxy-6-metoxy-1,4-benzoquinol methylase